MECGPTNFRGSRPPLASPQDSAQSHVRTCFDQHLGGDFPPDQHSEEADIHCRSLSPHLSVYPPNPQTATLSLTVFENCIAFKHKGKGTGKAHGIRRTRLSFPDVLSSHTKNPFSNSNQMGSFSVVRASHANTWTRVYAMHIFRHDIARSGEVDAAFMYFASF